MVLVGSRTSEVFNAGKTTAALVFEFPETQVREEGDTTFATGLPTVLIAFKTAPSGLTNNLLKAVSTGRTVAVWVVVAWKLDIIV